MGVRHVIREGECVASVAFAYGFHPDTLWNAPENAELRARRPDGYSLAPGDILFVPDLRQKELSIETGMRHKFRRRGVPERLQLQLLDPLGRPRAGLGYRLAIDGAEQEGKTDAEGWIRVPISPAAQRAVLRLENAEVYEIGLGRLMPAESVAGVQQRLRNLGYSYGEDAAAVLGEGTRNALARFFEDRREPVPEVWDDAAVARVGELLRELHGS